MFIARNKGWLDERQVRLLETPSATSTLQALTSGIVDAGALTLDEVLRARAQGLPLSVALVFDESAGADMLLAHPEIGTLKQLAGRRVAAEQSGVGALVLAQALQSVGLKPADVRQVALPPASQWEAWQRGEIDAAVTYPPYALRLLDAGARRLYDSRQMPHVIVDVLAVNPATMEHHAMALRQLIAAHFRALSYVQQQPAEAAKLLLARAHLSTDEFTSLFNGLRLPDLAENQHWLTGRVPLLDEAALQVTQSLQSMALLPHEVTHAGLVRGDFLPGSKEGEHAPA